MRASGKRLCASSVSRSIPGPTGARRPSASQDGQRAGIGLVSPHWWHIRRFWNRCSTMRASQSSQPIWWPHARHSVTGAYPRRLINNSDCSPACKRCSIAFCSVCEIQRPAGRDSPRISIAPSLGITAAPNRAANSRYWYLPASALAQLSKLGVAEASTTRAPQIDARSTAMSRA